MRDSEIRATRVDVEPSGYQRTGNHGLIGAEACQRQEIAGDYALWPGIAGGGQEPCGERLKVSFRGKRYRQTRKMVFP